MDEAGVELLVSTQVPELEPMCVVDVGVATEHLAVDIADVVCELGREARSLAQPVVGIRGVQCWRGADEGVCGEYTGVRNLAGDPFLDVRDVLRGWDADTLAFGVEPGVGHGACAHGRAGLLVADGDTGVTVGFLDDLEHAI